MRVLEATGGGRKTLVEPTEHGLYKSAKHPAGRRESAERFRRFPNLALDLGIGP